ncbi:ATPase [Aureococcus anophagefferens]|nr:ATPase [Aureococcus anophagefferens]
MADQVPPTRMALQTYKGKKAGASKGHQLLKKKADALKARFRDIAKEIYKTKGTMSESCSTAYFSLSLTAAQYAAGDFKTKVLEGNFVASVRVTGQTDNIAGVKIPVFRQFDTGAEHLENIGLAGGGRKIAECKEKFTNLLAVLVKLASQGPELEAPGGPGRGEERVLRPTAAAASHATTTSGDAHAVM